jgi:predicted nucleic acid-binding Zn ribbon protein
MERGKGVSNKKCAYCNKLTTDDKIYCDDKCENYFNKFQSFFKKYKVFFVILIAMNIIVAIVGSIITITNLQLGISITCIGIMILSGTIIVLPFATPETFSKLGIKKTILIIRLLGLLLLIGSFSCYHNPQILL